MLKVKFFSPLSKLGPDFCCFLRHTFSNDKAYSAPYFVGFNSFKVFEIRNFYVLAGIPINLHWQVFCEKFNFPFARKVLKICDSVMIIIELCDSPSDFLFSCVISFKSHFFPDEICNNNAHSSCCSASASYRTRIHQSDVLFAILPFSYFKLDKSLQRRCNNPQSKICYPYSYSCFHGLLLRAKSAECLLRSLK